MGKSTNKKVEQMQQNIAQKYNIPQVSTLKLSWCFDKWYEKLIIVGMLILSIWKIMGWLI